MSAALGFQAPAALSCARCNVALEPGDLRCPICALATPMVNVARPVGASILRCDGCGAAVSYNADVRAPKCGFCDSVMRVEQPVDPVDQAELVLRLALSVTQADEALRGWMKTLGFFRPSDLAALAQTGGLRPTYFCAWIVNADALVSFAADSDAGAGRSAWAPHSGQARMAFRNVLVSASRGLTHAECAKLAPSYDLRALQPVGPMPQDLIVEAFDVQRSMARRRVIEALQGTAVHRVQAEGLIPGRSFRNVHAVALLHGLQTRRVLLPAYIFAYRYKGKPYRAIVSGADPRMVFGDAPISWRKVALVVIGVAAIIAVVVFALSR